MAQAQQQAPDLYYRQQHQVINNLLSRTVLNSGDTALIRKNVRLALQQYTALARKYRLLTTDMPSYFMLSIAAENARAFNHAAALMVTNSGEPLSRHLALRELVYFFFRSDSMNTEKPVMAAAIKKARHQEQKWIKIAQQRLDWQWVKCIEGIFRADYNFRSLNREWYKDSQTHWQAMCYIDSVHMGQFCSKIAERGFPDMSVTGLNAAQIQAPLRHWTGLISVQDTTLRRYYINQWKWLLPQLYQAVNRGEMEPVFYRLLCQWLCGVTEKAKETTALHFFQQYLPKD